MKPRPGEGKKIASGPAVCLFLALLFLPALGGCGEPEMVYGERWIAAGEKKIRVDVALTPAQQERGLKFRKRLKDDEGMIFVYAQPVRHAFWMKDTRIPLSIAFLDPAGRVLDIQDMAPFDTTPHFSPVWYQYALEMNQGWFGRNNVKVRDVIGLE